MVAPQPGPSMAAGNKTFARTLGDALISAQKGLSDHSDEMLQTVKDVGTGYAPIEAALNLSSGLLFGVPAQVLAGGTGLIAKHLLGMNVDPAEMAQHLQKLVTYEPHTEAGRRLTGNVNLPFQLWGEQAEKGGHGVAGAATRAGFSTNAAAWAGSITEQTLGFLPYILTGELARKMGGQTIGADDMANVARVAAGPDAAPEAVTAVEHSLLATYEQTGIGPYTVLEHAERDPQLRAELADPAVEVPTALKPFVEQPKEPGEAVPGDGEPLLDVSGPMRDEPPDAAEPAALDERQDAASPAQEGAEQPSGATYREGAGTLNAGLNPAAVLSGVRDSYTPFVGVEADHVKPPTVDSTGAPKNQFLDDLRRVFAPASRGDAAAKQAGIMRANFGEMAREREVALERLKETAAGFDRMPVDENIKFIDAMERGASLEEPRLKAAAAALRELLDAKRDQVRELGKGQLENFDENYFPHMWKDPDAAQALFARRPLTGSGAFLKERTIPFTTDGLRWRAYDADGDFVKSFDTEAEAKAAAGAEGRVGAPLKPITTNPVELALLKAREMDKYVYGQKIFAEMKDADLARFVPFGSQAAPGWTKINDKIARVLQPNEGEGGGMILRGEYYAPDEAATLINNHLSPGLQGNTFYQLWRGAGNSMNALQLGLSFFHVGFTTMDSMISKVALGMKQISRGDVLEGGGNVLQGLNPAQPFVNIYKGDKLLRAYLGKLDDPSLAPIVDAIAQAGGRVKMDDLYRNEAVNAFKQALRNTDYVGAAKAFLPTVLDRVGAPIFEWLVPRQKLGVFFDMARDWLKENPRAGVNSRREGLGKLWDSVDNRMGQLVYDNVFWTRALKDGLMATVRSVGWNLGTFRELGGGVFDIKDIARNKGFSDRTAYVVALPFVSAIYGSVMNYAYTGEAPRDIKDAFYPRTGRLRPDGSEDRVSLPTYMKDVFAYGEDIKNFALYGADPTQTLKNKAHPLIATISQMLNNEDFFGGAIRNPADPAIKQMQDEAAFLAEQIQPFSIRNYLQQAKLKGEEPSFVGYMTSPSMIGITPAPAHIVRSPEQNESAQVSRVHDSLIQKYREEIKAGADPEQLIPAMVRGGLTRADIRYVIRSSGEVPPQHRLKAFGDGE